MILTEPQIINIIKNNPQKDFVNKGCLYNRKMRMHMHGEGLDNHISKIDLYEKDDMKNLRKKYARSNKDLFSRLARPIDKVFSARGGSTYYHLNGDGDKKALAAAMNVRDGYTAKKYVENFWKPHMLDDPFGIIFMEIGDGDAEPVGMAYPTYKPITCIYDYLVKGSSLEYVAFPLDNADKEKFSVQPEDKLFRLVDDANDYIILQQGESITIQKQLTIPNYFRKVPAMLNSDFISGNDGTPISLFDDVVALADDFILDGSIRNLSKFRHAFPKYWEYGDSCKDCMGTAMVGGKECETCKGTGKALMITPGDAKVLNYPDGKDTPLVTPNVAGYVTIPIDYFQMSKDELVDLETAMEYTTWGASSSKTTTGPTGVDAQSGQKSATQVIDDMQPKIDRLYPLSESAEKRHKFIVDLIIQQNLRIANYTASGGASVNYGRRYLIESADAIWDRYINAKKSGATITVLDDLLLEFIETKYSGDQISLSVKSKLMNVEPFVHLTIGECKPLLEIEIDFLKKLYFNEWLNTLKANELVIYDEQKLKQSLEDFANELLIKLNQHRDDKATALANQQKATQDITGVLQGQKIDKLAESN